MLGDLQLGEFIYEQPALPDVEYTFKHALTHEVAYGSVLNERRKPLHERTAQALESLFADQARRSLAGSRPPLQPQWKYRQGDTLSADGRRAGGPALRSRRGDRACLIPRSKCSRACPKVRSGRGGKSSCGWLSIGSLVANKGYAAPEVAESARRALELSSELGEPELHFSALMFAWAFHQVSRDLERAAETSRELIELAERAREPAMIVHANLASGAVSLFCGRLRCGPRKTGTGSGYTRSSAIGRDAAGSPGRCAFVPVADAVAAWLSRHRRRNRSRSGGTSARPRPSDEPGFCAQLRCDASALPSRP